MTINNSGAPVFDHHGREIPSGGSFAMHHAPASHPQTTKAATDLRAIAQAIEAFLAAPEKEAIAALEVTHDLNGLAVVANLDPRQEVRHAARLRVDVLEGRRPSGESDEQLTPEGGGGNGTGENQPQGGAGDENLVPTEEELAKLSEAVREIAKGKAEEVVAAIATLTDKAALEVLAGDRRKTVAKAALDRLEALEAK